MLKLALPILLSAALAGLVTSAAPVSGSTAKKAPSKSARKKAGGAKTKASAKKSSKKKPAKSWRTSQQQPAPERYREIQQALIGRGYLQGPATGQWGPESAEALKKFQLEQNLKGDGKLDSLSLIALGLGPKRTAIPQTRAQP